MRMRAFFIVLLILLGSRLSVAQELMSWDSAYPLRGLKSLAIAVDDLSEDAKKIGLSTDRLRTVTELKLRKEGIGIENLGVFSLCWLRIKISVVGRAFNILLDLKERVALTRDINIVCMATTWYAGSTGTHGDDAEYIVSGLNNQIDYFLNDYYKANPKK